LESGSTTAQRELEKEGWTSVYMKGKVIKGKKEKKGFASFGGKRSLKGKADGKGQRL